MMDLFSPMFILLYAALLGITMKLADLFDEHRMHWFKGDTLVFGVLWGFFGILLVLSRSDIANVTLAMVVAFLIRMRIDYRNHSIASTIIIITFIWKGMLDFYLFFIFFLMFAILGGIRDYFGDIRKKKDLIYKINEVAWYYTIPTAIYGYLTGNWTIFYVFTVYIIFYDLIKYGLFYMKKYKNL